MANVEYNMFFDDGYVCKFKNNTKEKKVPDRKTCGGNNLDRTIASSNLDRRSQNEQDSKSFLSTGASSSNAKRDGPFSHIKGNNSTQRQQHAGLEGKHSYHAARKTSTGETPPLSPSSEEMVSPSTTCGYSPILPAPTPEYSFCAKGRWSVCEALDGEQLDAIAKGMMRNERLPKLKKGVKIAGRRIGKAKAKRKKKEGSSAPSTGGYRPKARKSSKARCSGTAPSNLQGDGESTSDLPLPRSQCRDGKKRRRRRRKRPQPEPPPEGQVRRNELMYKLATNPCQLDPLMQHNKTVHTQFGGHITELTEPQAKIRRRRRSNQVKDAQMDFDL